MAKSSAPDEINNAFTREGPAAPANMRMVMNNDGSTIGFFNGKKDRVNMWMNPQGAGIGIICPNSAGPGDGKKMAPGRRFTKSHLAGNADSSQPTFMKISNPDGTGMSFDSGGGRKSTILISTGDGQSGALFTKGFVALFCDGTELILHGAAGKITSTYHLIQETNKGGGSVGVKTYGA
jgi:hypothetical protein